MSQIASAELAVKVSARMLDIEPPQIIMTHEEKTGKEYIIARYTPYDHAIRLDQSWLEQSHLLEVYNIIFHEVRHAYQHLVAFGNHFTMEPHSEEEKEQWRKELIEYIPPPANEADHEPYLRQSVEIDAIAFSHHMIKRLYDVRTMIPDVIRPLVEERVIHFQIYFSINP